MVSNVVSEIKTLPYYGSKAWANSVLKIAIKELKNSRRVLSARQLEVFYFLGELERLGYRWQVARLRNHINLVVKQGRFTAEAVAEADSLLKREEASS